MKTKEVSTYSTLKTKCSLLAFDNVVTRQHCIIIYMKKAQEAINNGIVIEQPNLKLLRFYG